MKETFLKLISYLKIPILGENIKNDLNYHFKIFFYILFISILTGLLITPIFSLLEEMNWIKIDNHKVKELFSDINKLLIILTAGLILVGSYFGYVRMRFGMPWFVLSHSSYNCFFILISFIFQC